MPVPEASRRAVSAASIGGDSVSISDDTTLTPTLRHASTMYSAGEWEEPHPGEPLPCLPARNACEVDGEDRHSALGAYNRIGMAAKGYAPYYQRARLTGPSIRRLQRIRIRPTSLKSLRIPTLSNPRTQAPAARKPEIDVRRTPKISVRPASVDFITSPLREDQMLEDAPEAECRPMSCVVESTPTSGLSTPRMSTNDSSNHLNVRIRSQYDGDRIECDDDGVYRNSSDDDSYGWEAEFNKVHCVPLDCRRAAGSRKSLLHRVFSLGPRDIS